MLYRTGTIRLIALAMALVATPVSFLAAQTITFPAADFPGGATTAIPDGYGSTPGVATTYKSLDAFGNTAEIGGMRWWDSGHASLNGVAYGVNRNASVAEIGLMSTGAGGSLALHDFDIGSWNTLSRTLFLQVLGWDYSLIYEIQTPIGRDPFSFASYLADIGAGSPERMDGFRIQWTQDRTPSTPDITDRGSYDVAIDNIAFSGGGASVVPEPASVVLLATGLAGLAMVGQRNRRRGRTKR